MDEEKRLPAPEGAEPEAPQPVKAEETREKRIALYVALAVALILALIIGSIVLMYGNHDATVKIRDIAIVFVAVMTFFIGVAMLVLTVQLAVLVKMLREEVTPLMESLQETLATVRGTTTFVSESVVSPVVKVAGFAAAVRQVAGDLFGVVHAVQRKPTKSSTGGKNDGQE